MLTRTYHIRRGIGINGGDDVARSFHARVRYCGVATVGFVNMAREDEHVTYIYAHMKKTHNANSEKRITSSQTMRTKVVAFIK